MKSLFYYLEFTLFLRFNPLLALSIILCAFSSLVEIDSYIRPFVHLNRLVWRNQTKNEAILLICCLQMATVANRVHNTFPTHTHTIIDPSGRICHMADFVPVLPYKRTYKICPSIHLCDCLSVGLTRLDIPENRLFVHWKMQIICKWYTEFDNEICSVLNCDI